jgi:hypothetical protein
VANLPDTPSSGSEVLAATSGGLSALGAAPAE